MPDVTISRSGDVSVTVNGADVNETRNFVRVVKAGIKAEINSDMEKAGGDDAFSVEVNGAVTMGLNYDDSTTTADSISFTKDG